MIQYLYSLHLSMLSCVVSRASFSWWMMRDSVAETSSPSLGSFRDPASVLLASARNIPPAFSLTTPSDAKKIQEVPVSFSV